MTISDLRIGGGGFLRGIYAAPDGTIVVHADSYGAYYWNPTAASPGNAGGLGVWQQLVTLASIGDTQPNNQGGGVYEIVVAPSNTNVAYMYWQNQVYVTTNLKSSPNHTWTLTNFSPVAADPNAGNAYIGRKMAVDPTNPDIVFVGTPNSGLFTTTGGTSGGSWSQVTAVGSSSTGNYQIVAIDPTNHLHILVSTYGTGVYESTDGGSSWTKISDGTGGTPPKTHNYLIFDAGGTGWLADNSGNLWKWASSTWTEDGTVTQAAAIAGDPSNANNIVAVVQGGNVWGSSDHGSTWTNSYNNTRAGTDVPWLSNWGSSSPGDSEYLSIGGAIFDNVGNVWIGEGTGSWYQSFTTLHANGPHDWISRTAGIENLIPIQTLFPWGGGSGLVTAWDKPFFQVTSAAQVYPSNFGANYANSIRQAYGADWIAGQSPSAFVGVWGPVFSAVDSGAINTNGGDPLSWTNFASLPPLYGIQGTIVASTTTNFLFMQGGNKGDLYYTTNGAASWTKITISGVPSSPSTTGWGNFAASTNSQPLAADRVTTGTFYVYNNGGDSTGAYEGIYVSTDGGATWAGPYGHGALTPTVSNLYAVSLKAVPSQAGNLFFSGGYQQAGNGWYGHPMSQPFYRSTNAGHNWSNVSNGSYTIEDVWAFNFGAAAPGQSYPAIYIYGWVNNVPGLWRSIDNCATWQKLSGSPNGSILGTWDTPQSIGADGKTYGLVYVAFSGSSWKYYSEDTHLCNTAVTSITYNVGP